MAIKHDSLITVADNCNVVVNDVMNIKDKMYVDAGIAYINKAKEVFFPPSPMQRQEIINKCKELAIDIKNIRGYLLNNIGATDKTIDRGGAYIKALNAGGIIFNKKRGGGSSRYVWKYYAKLKE